MPDAFHEVVYRAVADFSAVVREAAKTRAELAALNADITKFKSAASGGGTGGTSPIARVAADAEKSASAAHKLAAEVDKTTTTIGQQNSTLEKNSQLQASNLQWVEKAAAAQHAHNVQQVESSKLYAQNLQWVQKSAAAQQQHNVEISKSRELLERHLAAQRAAGTELDKIQGKQFAFDGFGQKALQSINSVAGRMREVVKQHQDELARLTDGRDFTFADKPGKVTQAGLFSKAQALGEKEITGPPASAAGKAVAYALAVKGITAAIDGETKAIEQNTAAAIANAAVKKATGTGSDRYNQLQELQQLHSQIERSAKTSALQTGVTGFPARPVHYMAGEQSFFDYENRHAVRAGLDHDPHFLESTKQYKDMGYDPMNSLMRDQPFWATPWHTKDDIQGFIDKLREVFATEAGKFQENIAVYRGFKGNEDALHGAPGNLLHDPSFQSTSFSLDTAKQFAGTDYATAGSIAHILQILVPKGTGGIHMGSDSDAVLGFPDHEHEMLAEEGRYRITGVKEEGFVKYIQAELLSKEEFTKALENATKIIKHAKTGIYEYVPNAPALPAAPQIPPKDAAEFANQVDAATEHFAKLNKAMGPAIKADILHYDEAQNYSSGRIDIPGSYDPAYLFKQHGPKGAKWEANDLPDDLDPMSHVNLESLLKNIAKKLGITGSAEINDERWTAYGGSMSMPKIPGKPLSKVFDLAGGKAATAVPAAVEPAPEKIAEQTEALDANTVAKTVNDAAPDPSGGDAAGIAVSTHEIEKNTKAVEENTAAKVANKGVTKGHVFGQQLGGAQSTDVGRPPETGHVFGQQAGGASGPPPVPPAVPGALSAPEPEPEPAAQVEERVSALDAHNTAREHENQALLQQLAIDAETLAHLRKSNEQTQARTDLETEILRSAGDANAAAAAQKLETDRVAAAQQVAAASGKANAQIEDIAARREESRLRTEAKVADDRLKAETKAAAIARESAAKADALRQKADAAAEAVRQRTAATAAASRERTALNLQNILQKAQTNARANQRDASLDADKVVRSASQTRAQVRAEQANAGIGTARAEQAAANAASAQERYEQSLLRTRDLLSRVETGEKLRNLQLQRGELGLDKARRAGGRAETFRDALGEFKQRLEPVGKAFVNRAEVDKGVGLLGRLKNAFREVHEARKESEGTTAGGGGRGGSGGIFGTLTGAAANFGADIGNNLAKSTGRLITYRGLIVALLASLGPIIAALGALGAAAIGAGNALISASGVVAALPGLFLAAAAGIGSLILGFKSVGGVLQAYSAAQKASAQAAASSTKNLKGETQAQQDLNAARRDALRNLQDLATAVSRASLDEEGAILNLRRAQADYRKALADPNSSLLDREEALHRVKEAENDLADVRQKNTRNAEDLATAEAQGVEGSTAVRNALKAVAAGSTAAADAQAEYRRQLALLGPNTRKVVEALVGQVSAWNDIKKATSEALFAPVIGQLGKLPILLTSVKGLLTDAAGAVGDVLAKGIAMVTSGPWTADFATLSKNNVGIIHNFGDAALSVADAFRNIAVAAAPFTTWLSEGVKHVAGNFQKFAQSGRDSGGIAKFLETTKLRLQQFGTILSNIFHTFASFFFASSDFTGDFMEKIIAVTGQWRDFAKTQEEPQSKFRKWLEDVKPVLSAVAHFLGAIGTAFAHITADPRNLKEAHDLLQNLSDKVLPAIVDFLGGLSGSQAVSNIAAGLGEVIRALSGFLNAGGGDALKLFFGTLSAFLDIASKIVELAPVSYILGGIALGLAAIAAASVIGKFSGLFAVARALGFIIRNRGALGEAFKTSILESLGFSAKPTGLASAGSAAAKDIESGKFVGVYTAQLDIIIGLLERIAIELGVADIENIPLGRRGGKAATKAAESAAEKTLGKTAAEDAAKAAGSKGNWFTRLFKRGGGKAAEEGAETAVKSGSKFARFGKLAGGFDPFLLPGIGIGIAADSGVLGKPGSTSKQLAQAGGAILTGAGIGLTVGGPIGAAVGAIAGAGYSLYKDKGLRDKATNFVTTGPGNIGGLAVERAFKHGITGKGGLLDVDFGGFKPKAILDIVTKHLSAAVGHALDSVRSYLQGKLASILKSDLYNNLIRPILAIFTGTNAFLEKAAKGIRSFIYTHLSKPLLDLFLFARIEVRAVYSKIRGWVNDHISKPVFGFFKRTGDDIAAIYNSGQKWVNEHLSQPVFGFLKRTGSDIASVYTKSQQWVNEHISQPVFGFFSGIGGFFAQLPTFVVGILEKIPGIGPEIAKKYRNLGYQTGILRRLPGKMSGGLVDGTYQGIDDNLLTPLTAGEWVTRRRVVQKPLGKQLLDDLNQERYDPADFYAALNGVQAVYLPNSPAFGQVMRPQSVTVSTVNNTGRGGLQVGDITINNPVRERSDRSLRRTLHTAAYLHDR